MRSLLPLTVCLASCVVWTAAVAQQTQSPSTAALTRLLSAPQPQAEWFSPEFLAQVPLTTIAAQLAGLQQAWGNFLRLETLEGRPLAVYERGTLIVTAASLDAQGRLTSFGGVPGPVPAAAQGAASSPASPAPPTASAQAEMVALLTAIFAPVGLDAALFAPDFLAQVPAATLQASLDGLRQELGAFVRVEVTGALPQVIFERGAVEVRAVQVNAGGKVTALLIAPVTPPVAFASLEEARAAFGGLPGQVSVLVRELNGGSAPPLLALKTGRLLAVGSTFKLAILAEAQAQVSRGERAWTDEVALTDADRSLPSGTLQDAPAGLRLTLAEVATRMIRDSDNTATDLLLRVVGRAGVEARLGQTALPSTREFFALKNPANLELLRAYRSAGLNHAARRAVLAQAAAAPLPPATLFVAGPVARDVEWFASTERLCSLMDEVAARPETQQNPGVAAPGDFQSVSYKGGSEPGVLNLTTQVTTTAGRRYCLSATWNDASALNEAQFMALYSGLLKLLR